MAKLRIAGCALVVIAGCSRPADKPPEAGSASAPVVPHQRKRDGDRREPVTANAPPLKLKVVSNGNSTEWEQAQFDATARYTKGSDGEARDVWSLRELVHRNTGADMRAVSVTGADGTKAIDAAGWSDAGKTPILHTTRRGTLKFRWADAEGRWSETEVKDVTQIELGH